MSWTASSLRAEISTVIAGLTPQATYQQISSDAWVPSQAPFAVDLGMEETYLRHMIYHVEIRDVDVISIERIGVRHRVVVSVYAILAIRPLGDHAQVDSWDQALAAVRHLWYALMDLPTQIADITPTLGDEGGYGVAPITDEYLIGYATVPIIYTDSLEARPGSARDPRQGHRSPGDGRRVVTDAGHLPGGGLRQRGSAGGRGIREYRG